MNPHDSFAPLRIDQKCKWFSNSADYMKCVFDAILNAKEEIFIADWWLSPEIYLKRPIDNLDDRLDKILIKKSEQGVHIYILLYNEFERFLHLNNSRAEEVLTQHGNNKFIHVIRHPNHHLSTHDLIWTHHEKCVIIDQMVAFLGGIDLCFGRWDDDNYKLVDLGNTENIDEDFLIVDNEPEHEDENEKNKGLLVDLIMGKYINTQMRTKEINEHKYIWIGKDYANTFRQDFKNVEKYDEDQFDRKKIPRMPWRDHGLVMMGKCVQDLMNHFKLRWEHAKGIKISLKEINEYNLEWLIDNYYQTDIQLLRSLDFWSGGIKNCELSIMNAYVDLISNAEHYVYIENQFFVTTCNPKADTDVKNHIGMAIANRIKKAFKLKQKFRVYIVLPLLPGFDNIDAIRAVQYYNLRSINLGPYSIFKELIDFGIKDPNEYITFHSMKKWSILENNLVSEIIYVHSKIMIVDDKYVLCGSANINDRSLLGSRDSEIGVLITDKEFLKGKLNNNEVEVGKYAHSLRKKIFNIHLNNLNENIDVNDCVCDDFYNLFRNISKKCTDAYNKVFKYQPSDEMLKLNDLKNYFKTPYLCANINQNDAKKQLENDANVLIINFPLKFFSNEKHFFPELDTIDGLIPKNIWI